MSKSKRRKKRLRRRFIFFLVIITALVYGGIKAVSILKPMLGFEEKNLKTLKTIDFKTNVTEDKNLLVKGVVEYICKYENNTISLYDNKGNFLWEKNESIEDPLIIGNDHFFIVSDKINGKVYYLDYQGNTLATINTERKIYDIKTYNNEYVAISLEEESKVILLDKNGEEITNIVVPKGEILDFQLSNNRDIIAISLLNVEEYDYYSNILLYSLDGRVLAGSKVEETIVFNLYFDENDRVFAFGDNKMLIISKEEGISWKKNITEVINKIDIMRADRIVVSFIKSKNTIIDTKNRSTINQMNLDGEVLYQTPIPEDILGLDSISNTIVAFSERTIYIIDNKGNIIIEKKINKDIEDIFWISDGDLALILKDKIEIITLNY